MAKLRQNMGKQTAQKMHPVDPLTSEVLANQGVTTDVEPVSGAIFGSDDQPAPQTNQPAPGDDDDNKDYARTPIPPRRGGGRRRRGLLADGGDPDEGSNDAGLS